MEEGTHEELWADASTTYHSLVALQEAATDRRELVSTGALHVLSVCPVHVEEYGKVVKVWALDDMGVRCPLYLPSCTARAYVRALLDVLCRCPQNTDEADLWAMHARCR